MSDRRQPRAAAIYCRISRDARGDALGVQRQQDLCQDLADRKGWPVAEVYTDNDVSAYSGKRRPEYERLLADLESGARDGVLVVDTDRLTRTPAELERFIDVADRCGVALANVSGDLDLSSSDGRFRARIMGAVARQESEKKSERLRREREQAAQQGRSHGGRRPFGYEPGGVDLRHDEALVVRELAERFLAGESLPALAKDLNERGVPTVYGGAWRTTSVRTLLASARIAGLRTHKGEITGEACWPAIITREQHERIRGALGDPRRQQRGRPPARLLTSMVVCGRCGATLASSQRRGRERRYVCHPTVGSGACGRIGVHADYLEAEVTDQVLAVLASPALADMVSTDDRDDGAGEELRAAEERLAELARDFAEGRIGRAEWLAARDVAERRVETARRSVERDTSRSVLASVPTDVDALHRRWEDAGLDWRRAVLGAVVDRVEVHPAQRGGRAGFDPERVRIVWRA